MIDAGQIHNAIAAQGIPIDWVECPNDSSFVLHFQGSATAEQRAEAEAIAQQINQAPEPPDWQGLKAALRNTDLLIKAISTTQQNAWSLLLNALDSNEPAAAPGRLADFHYAINAIRPGLSEDFTPAQITRFNTLLTQFHFPFQIT